MGLYNNPKSQKQFAKTLFYIVIVNIVLVLLLLFYPMLYCNIESIRNASLYLIK